MKKMTAIVLALVMLLAFTACGSTEQEQINYYAYITLPNGDVIEVEVDDLVVNTGSAYIKAKDGRKYRVSLVNCLITTDRLDEVEND